MEINTSCQSNLFLTLPPGSHAYLEDISRCGLNGHARSLTGAAGIFDSPDLASYHQMFVHVISVGNRGHSEK